MVAGSDMMPGQIPDPSLTAGSLPSLGLLAGISATTLTDQLKLAQDFRNLGAMLSPLHILGRLGKRPLTAIKGEMDEDDERRRRRRDKNKVAAARCRNKKKERTDFLQRVSLFSFSKWRLSSLCILWCSLCILWCSLCILWCSLCILWCSLYILWCSLCILWCSLCILWCSLCILWCSLCILWCSLCILWCSLCILWCSLYIVRVG
nr:unnamed protein product [Salmo salar]XP_013999134.1 unnamed protein product [Salmo salar]XP_013999135.1 unnamed protein product [Salmo salar]XP_013999136.1 unnamed protein product [Salmo salar]|eukprot:XP_013999133.1 PREDICTED: uncharacterized protein LOC106571029 [Salmo salar]